VAAPRGCGAGTRGPSLGLPMELPTRRIVTFLCWGGTAGPWACYIVTIMSRSVTPEDEPPIPAACQAALCTVPPTHYVRWMQDGARHLNLVCAGHAAVAAEAVESGDAARHGHTPVTVSGPYTLDGLARQVAYLTRVGLA
jgi:hypothetical protein